MCRKPYAIEGHTSHTCPKTMGDKGTPRFGAFSLMLDGARPNPAVIACCCTSFYKHGVHIICI